MSEEPGDAESVSGWKTAVLADFARWLEEVEDAPDQHCEEPADGSEPYTDLHTLLSEMAALRQEVRLQTREQARALRHVEGEGESLKDAVARLGEVGATLQDDVYHRAHRAGVHDNLVPMLEVRDALERGCQAAGRVAGRRWLRPRGLEAVTAGYDMALARFDRILTALGVSQVEGIGAVFDPRTMVAATARSQAGVADQVVVEVLRTGFVWDDGVLLRPAEVVVNRTSSDQSATGGDK